MFYNLYPILPAVNPTPTPVIFTGWMMAAWLLEWLRNDPNPNPDPNPIATPKMAAGC